MALSSDEIYFSDKSAFEVLQGNTKYVKRTSNKEFAKNCIIATVKHPPIIKVWSVISPREMETLHIIEGMMD